jgi:fatty acid desaturase
MVARARLQFAAAGYLIIFAPPALLLVATVLQEAWLVTGTVFLVFPLARMIFGATPTDAIEWRPTIRKLLSALPYLYIGAFAISLATFWNHWSTMAPRDSDAAGWITSLWVTCTFGTCIAHDLLHRASPRARLAGHLLAGATGYPILGYEHLRHHRMPGNTAAAEWPRIDEPAWGFVDRRLSKLLAETLGSAGLVWRGAAGLPQVLGLRAATGSFVAMAVMAGSLGGTAGMLAWLATAALVALTIQLITYIQHWALGDDSQPDAQLQEWAWEDDCWFQNWITLGLSLHHAHHQTAGATYYQLAPHPAAPRLPSGYMLLLLPALVPALWRQIMIPALDYWRDHPAAAPSSRRRLTCIADLRRR